MTVKTYFTMNARIVAILRWSADPTMLYAAQRIEELEQMASVRGECLSIAMKMLRHYAELTVFNARETVGEIEARLAVLEQGTFP